MNLHSNKIFNSTILSRIISTAVLISFTLHLTAIHPTSISLVICKDGNETSIEKVNSEGNCEHERPEKLEQNVISSQGDCEDTPLFVHQHDYEVGKISTGNTLSLVKSYFTPSPYHLYVQKIVNKYSYQHSGTVQSKIVETRSLLI